MLWAKSISLTTSVPMLLDVTSRVARMANRLWRKDNGSVAFEHRDEFYRTVWTDAARSTGATVIDLGAGILEIRHADVRTKVCRNYCGIDDPVTLMLAGNKPLVLRLLYEAGLPVPLHATFTLATLATAAALLDRLGRPCVIKPAKNTGGGKGVSTGITTRRQMMFAAAAAAAYDRELLIEEDIAGTNYRLLYLDGRLIDAVRRDFPVVVGDGRASIAELVKRTNNERLHARYGVAQTLLMIDGEMRRTLARQHLSLGTVPECGRRIIVKAVVNDNAGADNASAVDLLCPDIIDCGRQAAETLGVRLAGVDIITPDASRPLPEAGGRIIEVNTTPGFYMHYAKQDGPFRVAEEVLAAIFGTQGAGGDDGSVDDHGLSARADSAAFLQPLAADSLR